VSANRRGDLVPPLVHRQVVVETRARQVFQPAPVFGLRARALFGVARGELVNRLAGAFTFVEAPRFLDQGVAVARQALLEVARRGSGGHVTDGNH
jgi:hypothetical protein